MKRSLVLLFGGLALLLPPAAPAGSPGPSARQSLLGLGSCDGGKRDGLVCVDDFDCEGPTPATSGTCTTPLADLALRGVLTIVSDKDSGDFEDTTTTPQVLDAAGNLVPTDFSRSTLTLILEVEKDGKNHVFAETFQDLGDYLNPALSIDCRGFCVPTWREPAVEARIANPDEDDDGGTGGGGGGGGGSGGGGGGGQQAGGGVRIQWATPPPAMRAALVEALGLPEGATPFLEIVKTFEIADRAAEDDPLATVRRFKVQIRALLPDAAP